MKRLLTKMILLLVAVMIGVSNAINAEDETVSAKSFQTEQQIDLEDPK